MLSEKDVQNIKELIKLCKETGNYKALANTAYILLYNKTNEMGIRLGFNPIQDVRKLSPQQQVIFLYLNAIEKSLKDNFNLSIFGKPLLSNLNRLENLYHKASTFEKFELSYIRQMFELLFELEAIKLPNLHKQLSEDRIESLGSVKLFSSLLKNGNGKENRKETQGFMSQILEYNLHQQETQMERKLQKQYDPETVEKLLLLKQVKNSLDASSGRVKIKGTLAESMRFRRSFSLLYGYFMLGVMVVFFGMGIITIGNGLFSPKVFGALSPLLIVFFGAGAFFLFIYWTAFMKNKGD